jgi:hypothetical protein
MYSTERLAGYAGLRSWLGKSSLTSRPLPVGYGSYGYARRVAREELRNIGWLSGVNRTNGLSHSRSAAEYN